MDKMKDTVKKGLDKVVKTDMEPREPGKATLDAAMPSQQQPTRTAAGPDPNFTTATDGGNPTGLLGKNAMGQPTNKPRP
ncbi:hypothetical protein N657DRAFT_645740 [Parathielavia appendiculata]|uniref:Uncharacterized protein n=1 Tax=Parathielavia appendiculata TaxID=2587402 RepID=A0AAN6Z318_9PEZI|nr:hypothetical protein N657DRAFT_645740 [Parathielavia appendiculata]